ncbi:hypothetical protein [Rhizobium leguminosarum]|nr:hypothetical protein [Rhizobium leguminosarum]
MPDVVPVVDQVAAINGLFVATGMSGHGFGIGPGIGRVASDLIQGNGIGHNLHRFRLSRFTDGSAILLGPAIGRVRLCPLLAAQRCQHQASGEWV